MRLKGEKADVDEWIRLDQGRRDLLQKVDCLRGLRNRASEEIAQLKRAEEDASVKIAEMRKTGEEIQALEADLRKTEERLEEVVT